MSTIPEYKSDFSGEEIDSVVTTQFSSCLKKFCDSSELDILPKKGDYSAEKLKLSPISIPSNLNFLGVHLTELVRFIFDNQCPVGNIISFFGIRPPYGYLHCDGKTYLISDFPRLSSHFLEHFGSANYFGGDGETTFAVPDLRGEFLRGAGTATRATGSGADPGVHQDPTKHIYGGTWNNYFAYFNPSSTTSIFENADATFGESTESVRDSRWTSYAGAATHYTGRPTNTSVMFCIKY